MTAPDETLMTIGELARRSGTPATTLRYYEREGLLPRAERVGGQRRYSAEIELQLAAINLAKAAGFTLSEVKRFAGGFSSGTPVSARWRQMAASKLEELDLRAAEIDAMRGVLQRGLDCDCLDLADCGLVATRGSGAQTATA